MSPCVVPVILVPTFLEDVHNYRALNNITINMDTLFLT